MALSIAIILFSCPASASISHRESEIAYARAKSLQRHLEAKPFTVRTREDYERALDAYRAVYHADPASPDAALSIAAVADLLAGEGRCFHDAKLSHDAVAQWEFLRNQYPGSPLRQFALFQEALVEQNDLHDRVAAKKIDRSFMLHYPRDPLAAKARAALYDTAQSVRSENVPPRGKNFERPPAAGVEFARRVPQAEAPRSTTDSRAAFIQAHLVSRPVRTLTSSSAPTASIQAVRYWAEGNATRLAIDLNRAVPYHAFLAPNGKQITLIFFGAHPSTSLIGHSILVQQDANLRSIRAMMLTGDQAELVLELNRAASFSTFVLSNPDRLILNVQAAKQDIRTAAQKNYFPALTSTPHPKTPAEVPVKANVSLHPRTAKTAIVQTSSEIIVPAAALAEPAISAQPNADGQRSMARVLGLQVRRIVIDAGHGGHDSGTIGPDGLEEKDVALDVALRLGRLLHRRLGADVIYTRSTDKFIPLEERTVIANRAHADLFLSIHANSSSDPDVRGVETYFLNFTASPDALQVAARENAISNRSVHDLSNLVRQITLSDKIDESREFAADLQQSLYSGLVLGNPDFRNRGVKQAPFVVLIGAHMPSILAEISFLTNPEDAGELARPTYRERLAESLYRGVAEYVDGMSGVRVAKTALPEAMPLPAE